MDKADFTISIFLEARRKKINGLYSVNLRVFSHSAKKARFFQISIDNKVCYLSKADFKSVWETKVPREKHKDLRIKLDAIKAKANKVAKDIIPFSFTQFEKKLFRKTGAGHNVIYQYGLVIEKYKDADRFGTASNYELSLKSLKDFASYPDKTELEKLSFAEITPEWLERYEKYMVETKKLSRTTVAIYLRPLRAVFNTAISEKEIDIEIYPFGGKKYQIPSVKNVKKALSNEHLKQLYKAKPITQEQKKAKDFWFFSYACNGMNIKDIALLRYKDLQDNKLIFYRAKTLNTSATNVPVTVYLNDFTKSIIKKYGNANKTKTGLIFPIIADNESSINNFNKIKNFTKFINQNLKKLAISEGITADISTYWARHSFATNAIRNGASMEFVSEALNHSNLKTTQGYFAGFEDKDKKELMSKIMDFK